MNSGPEEYFFYLFIVNNFVESLPHSTLSGMDHCMKLLITLIGLIFVLEGLPYVAFPEAMQRWLKQLLQMRPDQLRVLGMIAMGTGFFLCFLGQKSGLFG